MAHGCHHNYDFFVTQLFSIVRMLIQLSKFRNLLKVNFYTIIAIILSDEPV